MSELLDLLRGKLFNIESLGYEDFLVVSGLGCYLQIRAVFEECSRKWLLEWFYSLRIDHLFKLAREEIFDNKVPSNA